jgi:hypothetical protein
MAKFEIFSVKNMKGFPKKVKSEKVTDFAGI